MATGKIDYGSRFVRLPDIRHGEAVTSRFSRGMGSCWHIQKRGGEVHPTVEDTPLPRLRVQVLETRCRHKTWSGHFGRASC
jgi:hypothetical protein